MRIDPAVFLAITPAAATCLGAPTGDVFAQLLGAGPAPASPLAGPVAPTGQPPELARSADENRPETAFAFGAFGLFAPGAGQPTTGDPAVAPAGVTPVDAMAQDAGGEPAAAPAGSLAALDGPGSPARRDGPGAAVRAASDPVGTARAANGPGFLAATSPPVPDPESAEGSGAAPRTLRPQARRPAPPSLIVAEQDGRLAVVAAAAHFDPADYGPTRARLAETAASLGASLEDFQINGQAGPAPVVKGERHGHRAR